MTSEAQHRRGLQGTEQTVSPKRASRSTGTVACIAAVVAINLLVYCPRVLSVTMGRDAASRSGRPSGQSVPLKRCAYEVFSSTDAPSERTFAKRSCSRIHRNAGARRLLFEGDDSHCLRVSASLGGPKMS